MAKGESPSVATPTSCSWMRKAPCSRPSCPEGQSTSGKGADAPETRPRPAATIFGFERGDDALKNQMYYEIHEQPEVLATISRSGGGWLAQPAPCVAEIFA